MRKTRCGVRLSRQPELGAWQPLQPRGGWASMENWTDEIALGKTRLFAGVSSEGLRQLWAISYQENHRSGELILLEGEIGEAPYLLLEGKVRISRHVTGGEEALAILGPGEAFGEMALVDDVPRSADAIVHESCRLLVLPREAFKDLLFVDKDLAHEVLWNFVRVLCGRLRDTNDKMTFL